MLNDNYSAKPLDGVDTFLSTINFADPLIEAKKSENDYDGDGNVESGAKEHAGAVHNAIQRKKGGKADGKDTTNIKEKIDVGADVGATISDFVKSKDPRFKGDTKKQRINRALGAYYGAQNEEVDHIEEEGQMQGGGKDPCWKGYEMVGMKKKGGREVPNCVPKEEYEELVMDMIQEGYDMDQVREVIGAYEDGFEVIFEEDGVVINETQEVLDEETQFLSDVEMVADWLHAEGVIENEDQFFELMEDLTEEEIQELYDVALSEAIRNPESRKKLNELSDKTVSSALNKRIANTGAAYDREMKNRTTQNVRDTVSAAGKEASMRSAVSKRRNRMNREEGYEMIGNSLEEGGMEVRNYSWEEVMEATAMAKRGHDETAIRNKIAANTGGGKSADRATALADKPTYGDSGKQKTRENLARKQRGDFRNTTSSSPGLHGYGHKSNDPAVKAKQAARGSQRGALTPNEKKQLGREGYEMIGNSLEEGGLEVRNYSWREVMESQMARNNPEKYEAGEKKKSAPVRGEKTPMPPRGDKRREDFEKWYAANVR